MSYDTNYCDEYTKRENAHIFHSPEYTDAFDDLSEEARESMTDAEIRKYMVDPEAEDRFEEAWTSWQNEHLAHCTNKACRGLYLRRKEDGLQ